MLDQTRRYSGQWRSVDATSAGSAVVSISAEHNLSVSISDAAGRGVMSAQIEPYNGSTPNALITWSCQQYDNVVTVSGFGDCLESRSIDALGNISKSRSDGAGRTLESEDADGNISTAKYDAGGNVKQSRDPNGVGFDAVYDELGRQTESTDTQGDVTKTVYNKAGQPVEQEDAKQNKTLTAYDARGRRQDVTDRLTGVTSYSYDLNSNLLSITDAETRVTGYEYDARNLKIKETYPDHVPGSNPGQAG